MTIEAGTTVNFDSEAYLNVNGTLLAQGTAIENIIFTGFKGASSWAIYFNTSSTNSVLENALIDGGGQLSFGTRTHVFVIGSSIEFLNSTSTNSVEAGIYLNNSTSTISNSHFASQLFGMKIYGSDNFPQLGEGITFGNNSSRDIYIDDINWCGALPEYLATSTNNNCNP